MGILRTEYFKTETKNGSPVEIHRRIHGVNSVFSTAWYEDFAYINLLNEKDLTLIKSLNLPNWYIDYTGKGMVLPLHKVEYVAKQLKEALKIKTPYHERK